MMNGKMKDVERQTDVRTVITVLESDLPTTLTSLVQELRHTQRKPVSGRKPLRRLLPIPSKGIAHIQGTVTSLSDPFCFESLSRFCNTTNESKFTPLLKIHCHQSTTLLLQSLLIIVLSHIATFSRFTSLFTPHNYSSAKNIMMVWCPKPIHELTFHRETRLLGRLLVGLLSDYWSTIPAYASIPF